MPHRSAIAAALWIGLSHVASAETVWDWMYIYPAHAGGSKSAWSTDQGTATDASERQSFDIEIGGNATEAEPDHLGKYRLKGAIHGNNVTAKLTGLDTDESPEPYSGKLVTQGDLDEIALMGPHGGVILLSRPAKR